MLRVTPLWDLCCWLSGPLHCPENQEPGGEECRAAELEKQVLQGPAFLI